MRWSNACLRRFAAGVVCGIELRPGAEATRLYACAASRLCCPMMSEPVINPYESPREAAFALAHSNKLDLVFFLVNFLCCLAFVFLGASAIVNSIFGRGSPYEFFGALTFIGPATLFAIGEWLLFVRRWDGLRRPLGVVCGAIAAFWAFAFVANVFEALFEQGRDDRPSPPDMKWFW
jgi:hypothetical protein